MDAKGEWGERRDVTPGDRVQELVAQMQRAAADVVGLAHEEVTREVDAARERAEKLLRARIDQVEEVAASLVRDADVVSAQLRRLAASMERTLEGLDDDLRPLGRDGEAPAEAAPPPPRPAGRFSNPLEQAEARWEAEQSSAEAAGLRLKGAFKIDAPDPAMRGGGD